jgi:hypothetical protein
MSRELFESIFLEHHVIVLCNFCLPFSFKLKLSSKTFIIIVQTKDSMETSDNTHKKYKISLPNLCQVLNLRRLVQCPYLCLVKGFVKIEVDEKRCSYL